MAEAPVTLEGVEGSGQAIRSALTLSLVTGRGFVIENLLPEFRRPGIYSQNLTVVQAAAAVCSAEVEGNDLHSTRLCFAPGKMLPGDYTFDLGTAGSTTLLLQTLCLPLVLAGGCSVLTLHGGTHVPYSPPLSYLEDAWIPALRGFGIEVDLQMIRPGFFPRGSGVIRARIQRDGSSGPFKPGRRGELEGVTIRSITGNLPFHVGERQLNHTIQILKDASIAAVGGTETLISEAPGTIIQLVGHFSSGSRIVYSVLGKKGQSAEEVADLICGDFLEFLDTPGNVDLYAADQLVIPLALAAEGGEYIAPKVTNSLKATAAAVDAFLPGRILVKELDGGGILVKRVDQDSGAKPPADNSIPCRENGDDRRCPEP